MMFTAAASLPVPLPVPPARSSSRPGGPTCPPLRPTWQTRSGWRAPRALRAARSGPTGGRAAQHWAAPGAEPRVLRRAGTERPAVRLQKAPGLQADQARASPSGGARRRLLSRSCHRLSASRRWRRGGRLSSRLMHDLQRRTALACCVCDPGGGAPFGRREHLLRHVAEDHGMRLCGLCLQVGGLQGRWAAALGAGHPFPMELRLNCFRQPSSRAGTHSAFRHNPPPPAGGPPVPAGVGGLPQRRGAGGAHGGGAPALRLLPPHLLRRR